MRGREGGNQIQRLLASDLPHVDELLHGSLSNKAIHRDMSGLAKPVGPILRLHIQSRVPITIENDNFRCYHEP
jgi:hypothetical protein